MDEETELHYASLSTHRLIIAVPNEGPVDVTSNLHPLDVARILRHLADRISVPDQTR